MSDERPPAAHRPSRCRAAATYCAHRCCPDLISTRSRDPVDPVDPATARRADRDPGAGRPEQGPRSRPARRGPTSCSRSTRTARSSTSACASTSAIRESAGTVVGSALAFRLFLFFIPLLLFVVGLAGFVAEVVDDTDVTEAGITGGLARQINAALTQPNSTRWIAVGLGFFGMITTGRSLSKVMVSASCLAWQLPVRAKASVKVDRRHRRADRRRRARGGDRQPRPRSISGWP